MTAEWSCPLPLRDHDRITIGHGGGGELGSELVDHLFLPAFGPAAEGATPTDSAVFAAGAERLAFTTDSYVVRPLFFPGGDIGELAVNGTVNDLSMAGARPLVLSTAFVLEEGLPLETLGRVAESMGRAATAAGVRLVTGDTKVVDAGLADGMYITTAGVGIVDDGVDVRPERAVAGDVVVVSGPIGRHGMAVLSVREGLEFGTELRSDTAPLNAAVSSVVESGVDIHTMRDLTRGGLAAALCEIAATAGVGIEYRESDVTVPEEVAAACGFLGLDPVHVANEGVFIAIVSPDDAEQVIEALRSREVGAAATVIGLVTDAHPGRVVARTALGAARIVERALGEQLPRIC